MCMGLFYADDGIIISRDPEWILGAITVLIGLFGRVRLMVNVAKYKTIPCQSGSIPTEVSEEDFS